ncbi:uncharacterized protein L969DRAFT_281045 [Mixia osmundae IAM 14324]|uniref:Uncharacterized protein n=1 Tax=Mixia osmundae (strain CBS 9802 / IAM 14324 / JCM 22182 / KY 12970) TaxID=764103 RepID=G7E4C2_MIXOS|nr:uncharacterized protein L969DRAFT_55731 [Mixia osmundae IAM 14324]XP_014564857.1 uncharacterized protein L969DRAFT_281045 [Mixia osmundae IAM 14324]KEI36125.1 hypothetical protein L969DRAFT_55731 [Mixia osmundae IAM 14324]KEI36301.1 hypothetical protein L969DRAFT_281045 [Mixia osmundae IAM 14324]GAA97682.1 hypothetical protein E5Q_04360 [Mixia osmundae IAM 14324]
MLLATTAIAIVSCALTLAAPTSSDIRAVKNPPCAYNDVAHLRITDSRKPLDVDITWCSAWAPSPLGNIHNFGASTPKTTFKFDDGGAPLPGGETFETYAVQGESAPNHPFWFLISYILKGRAVKAVNLRVFQPDGTLTGVSYTFTLGGVVQSHYKQP